MKAWYLISPVTNASAPARAAVLIRSEPEPPHTAMVVIVRAVSPLYRITGMPVSSFSLSSSTVTVSGDGQGADGARAGAVIFIFKGDDIISHLLIRMCHEKSPDTCRGKM